MSQSGTKTLENRRFQRMKQKGGDRRRTYDEVYPEMQDVGGIKVRASGEPFGTESHPPIQASVRCVLRHEVSEGKPTLRKVQRWIER